jgi:uncharacterized protein YndB with AHSA1/START domain
MATTPDLGTLHPAGDGWELRFTRRLAHRPERVWRALTEADDLAAWFPTTVEGPIEDGGKLRFAFEDDPGGMTMDGEVLACEPPRLLAFSWGEDTLRFELAADGDGTVLTFTSSFDELGRAARDAAGWHVCLDVLGYRLDGAEPPAPTERLWADVHPSYVDAFGPDAATEGPPEGHGPE